MFADDGKLSFDEFKSYFCDGVLTNEELKELFHTIDTHNTESVTSFLTSVKDVTLEIVALKDCFYSLFAAMWTLMNSAVSNTSAFIICYKYNNNDSSNSVTSLYYPLQGTLVSNAL